MQIFLDTADINAIEERYDSGIIAGVTTNPTLVANQGINYLELIPVSYTHLTLPTKRIV